MKAWDLSLGIPKTHVTLASWRLKSPVTWLTVNYFFRANNTKTPKPNINSPLWGESGGFPTQMASNSVNGIMSTWIRVLNWLPKLGWIERTRYWIIISHWFSPICFRRSACTKMSKIYTVYLWHAKRDCKISFSNFPDSKAHGANIGPTWVLSAPDGPHVGPMNLAIRVVFRCQAATTS